MPGSSTQTRESPTIEKIRGRCGEMMNGIRYTFKTHYKIAEVYEKGGRVMDLLVAAGTGGLVVALIWEAVSQEALITIAVVVAIISWSQAVLKLGEKSQKHYQAADRHHSLYEEFRDFIKVELPDEEVSNEEKRKRFQALSEKRDQINQLSPRTTNFWYRRIRDDVDLATAEDSSEEVEAILNAN